MQRGITPGVGHDPEILGGRPTLRGRRIAVSQFVDQPVGGMTLDEIRADYQFRDDEIHVLLSYIARNNR